MARKRRKAPAPGGATGRTTDKAAAAVCRLREVTGTPDFEAPAGSTVTLFTRDHIGATLILTAEYGGEQLVPPDQAVRRITLTTKAGRNTLKIVFVFSAGDRGQGELREDCGDGDSHFLRAASGSQPFQFFRILEQQS